MRINLLLLLISIFILTNEAICREEVTSCLSAGELVAGRGSSADDSEPGHPREKVKKIEQKLADLSYNPGKIDGIIDSHLVCALIAFQKMNGLYTDGEVDLTVMESLKNPVQPKPSQKHDGVYSEADLKRQIMTVYRNGKILRILPISSGSNEVFTEVGEAPQIARTPLGNFKFFAHIRGPHKSHLGELFNPVYFHKDGYAVHGDYNVPPYGASHGCLRITIMDSEWFSKTVPLDSHILISENALPASHQ